MEKAEGWCPLSPHLRPVCYKEAGGTGQNTEHMSCAALLLKDAPWHQQSKLHRLACALCGKLTQCTLHSSDAAQGFEL